MKTFLKVKGFFPYILIVCLNAMTDLGHKIILQNTVFKAYEGSELIMLTALVNALILLPFIFLFSPAGYVSDKYAKTKVIEYASLVAVGVTVLIGLSYFMGWFWVAFGLTFILALQSAIYSPAKYGLIKEMNGNENLGGANGVVQAVTVVSMLVAGVLFSILFEILLKDRTTNPSEILTYIAPVGFLIVFMSSMEYLLARKLSKEVQNSRTVSNEKFEFSKYKNFSYLRQNLSMMKSQNVVWLSILGLSLIWGISQVVLAIFGEHLKSTLGVTDTVVSQTLLAFFGIGMVIGSIFSARVSKYFIEIGIIPLGALGMTVGIYLLAEGASIIGLGMILFMLGFSSAIMMVPLNALIQYFTPTNRLGKVLAGNNFMQNISMFLFLGVTALLGYFSFSSMSLFYMVFGVSILGMLYALVKLPQSFVRYLARRILGWRYKFFVEGLENISSDKGVLLLGNHVSYLDWAILQMAYPTQIRFVMQRVYYEKWYLKPFFKFFGAISISSKGSKGALTQVTQALNAGQTVAMFPEGHLSRNGHLGVFQRGFELATQGVENAVIVPFYLRGLWEDKFSYASDKMKKSKNKEISVHFAQPIDINSKAQKVKKAVFELSIQSWDHYASRLPSIQEAWLETTKVRGKALCIADSTGVELNGYRFITGVFMFAKKLKSRLKKSQNVGVVLPTSVAGSMGNMALFNLGKSVVNLNYSSGTVSLLHALKKANITQIISSRQFVSKLKAKGFDLTDVFVDVDVVYLEDLKKQMKKYRMLMMLVQVILLPVKVLRILYITKRASSDTAAILFSSGSEGVPKGVELSHQNIMGNIKEIVTLLNPREKDVMLGTLPIFHSFGFTVTTLLPLIEGIPLVCHPDPTDGYSIGKIAAQYKATMLFATGTFFRLYTRNPKLHPLMFQHLRIIIAGAEKLSPEIRESFSKKFGHMLYEGYGTTECSPVASTNIEDVLMTDYWKVQKGNQQGSVGLPLPGTSFRIVNPETFVELDVGLSGMILIGGTQVMKGYIGDKEKTDSVIKKIDGIRWYVTGDKGYIDEHGFLNIVDRYSRFAKIAGEMVSLGLVESEMNKIIEEESQVAVVAVPDSKKAERLVLLLENGSLAKLQEKIKVLGLNPLYVPSTYFVVDQIPKLGTGKADFKGVKKLALVLLETGS